MGTAIYEMTGPLFIGVSGVRRYTVTSPFQRGPNAIDVLLPDGFDRNREHCVIYVLPVEPGIGGRYGNGLTEVRKSGLHNTHGFIAVQPAFDTEPWYCDHDSDPARRHESYIKQVVVPLIERELPAVRAPEGRMLLGFSKSGWGAFTLILRNPECFGYAASWDAPLMLEECYWGMAGQFGSDENFQRHRPANLFEMQSRHFRARARLALLGECSFGGSPGASPGASPGDKYAGTSHTRRAHERMDEFGILHIYDDSLRVEHRWGSGWVPFAVDALMKA